MRGRKTRSVLSVSALLLLAVAFSIVPSAPSVVGYYGARAPDGVFININFDGSVDPPNAPIIRTGETYLFTEDITTQARAPLLDVWRDGIVIGGNGYILKAYVSWAWGYGIWVHTSVTVKNTFLFGFSGGLIINSSSNVICGNTFENNSEGIIIGNNSFVYHNNFINNSYDVKLDWTNAINFWNDSYPSGGNYWSNYTGKDEKSGPNQDQPGSDGIGDTPYILDANNRDNYPLMNPYDGMPPTIRACSCTPYVDIRPSQGVKATANVTDYATGVKNVTFSFTIDNGGSWQNLAMNYNSSTGLYETDVPGQQPLKTVKYRIVAYDNRGNEAVKEGAGQYLVMMPTCLSISTQTSSAYAGYSVHINGTLCDFYGNYMKDEMIVLSYTFPGATGWNQITSANTGALGNYYVEWISPATGSFTIKAEWTGNATYFGVVKNVSLSSTPYQNSYVFSVESNSTITALAFDTANWELSFTATGPSGTSGYTKVTVAKSLVVDAASIKVYLDGNQIQYSLVSVDDSWQLVFSYMHSAHQASIALGPKPQVGEPSSLLIVGLIAVIVVVAALALIYFLRYRKATGRVN